MEQNTAVNLEPEKENDAEEKRLSVMSQAAQALSNPVNMPEYLADKLVGGVITSLTYIGITKGLEKYKEARALKKQQDIRVN